MAVARTFWTDSGGGGKTTMTMNVAHALENMDYRVLVWDIDHQRGCLTKNIGFKEHLVNEPSAMDVVFDRELTLNDVRLFKEDHEGLPFDLIPSTLQWENFESAMNSAEIANRWVLFKQALIEAGYPDEYDVILIDAKGSRGLQQRNAIVATQNVIIPTSPNPKGQDDVASGRDYIFNKIAGGMERSGINMNFSLNAVVPNGIKQQKKVHRKVVEGLHADESLPVTPFAFYDRGPYDDAADMQMTLFQFAESEETRDLYPYEHEILRKYELLAEIVLAGDVNAVSAEDVDGEVFAQ